MTGKYFRDREKPSSMTICEHSSDWFLLSSVFDPPAEAGTIFATYGIDEVNQEIYWVAQSDEACISKSPKLDKTIRHGES